MYVHVCMCYGVLERTLKMFDVLVNTGPMLYKLLRLSALFDMAYLLRTHVR